jgi:hypothetical protein
VGVHLAAKHALELELAHPGFELAGVAFNVARRRLIVLALGQFEQLRRVADCIAGAIEFGELADQPRALAPEFLGALRRAPDGGIFQLAADLF